jgi:DNA-binding response OmpR family regulator
LVNEDSPVILVVDDDPVIVKLLEINFRLEGFQPRIATGGRQAIDMVREVRPALVLLDLMMPGIDGWEVRRAMLEDPATANIPVIVVSARTQDEDRQQGYALGVTAYITKPFDPAELVDAVRGALQRSPSG